MELCIGKETIIHKSCLPCQKICLKFCQPIPFTLNKNPPSIVYTTTVHVSPMWEKRKVINFLRKYFMYRHVLSNLVSVRLSDSVPVCIIWNSSVSIAILLSSLYFRQNVFILSCFIPDWFLFGKTSSSCPALFQTGFIFYKTFLSCPILFQTGVLFEKKNAFILSYFIPDWFLYIQQNVFMLSYFTPECFYLVKRLYLVLLSSRLLFIYLFIYLFIFYSAKRLYPVLLQIVLFYSAKRLYPVLLYSRLVFSFTIVL